MLRMRTKLSILSAAVIAAAAGVNNANATITLSMTQIDLTTLTGTPAHSGTATDNATLDADGWIAYKITATATGTSSIIGGYDFEGATPANQALGYGVTGRFHQVSVGTLINPSQSSTPTANTAPGANGDVDSFFILAGSPGSTGSVPALPAVQPSEDDNGANGAGSVGHTSSPLTDNLPGLLFDYGTGTQIHAASAISNSSTVVDIGWFIVPKNSTITLKGEIYDQNGAGSPIFVNQSFGAAPIPEPASLGVLAMGGLALLARRRKA